MMWMAWNDSFFKNTKNDYKDDIILNYDEGSAVQRSLSDGLLTNDPKYNQNVV